MRLLNPRMVRHLPDEALNGCVHILMAPDQPIYELERGTGFNWYYTRPGREPMTHEVSDWKMRDGVWYKPIPHYFHQDFLRVQEKVIVSGFEFSLSLKTRFHKRGSKRKGAPPAGVHHWAMCSFGRAGSTWKEQIRVKMLADNPETAYWVLVRCFLHTLVRFNAPLIVLGTGGEIRAMAEEVFKLPAGMHYA